MRSFYRATTSHPKTVVLFFYCSCGALRLM